MNDWKKDLEDLSDDFCNIVKESSEEELADMAYHLKNQRTSLSEEEWKPISYKLNRVQEQIGILRRKKND